jgi:hypothetical protein
MCPKFIGELLCLVQSGIVSGIVSSLGEVMKKVSLILVLLLASCESYDNKCEPGRQLECYCSGGVEGFQECLEDGSGWGECQCECEKQCAGKCCGDDGCGGTCEDNCPTGYACHDLSCECELEKECEIDADCPADHRCDRTVWECKEIVCTPDCTGKCCGSDGCNDACQDNCPSGYFCNMNSCECEVERECQTNQDCRDLYGPDYWCDRTVWKCKEYVCTPNCTGRCCGDDGCGARTVVPRDISATQ